MMPSKKKDKPTNEELGNNFYKSGWKPGYDINEHTGLGELTHVGTDPNYKEKYDEILLHWGFDPKKYEIEGTVRASSWETQLKGGRVETFYAFKGLVRRKKPGHDKYFKELFKQAKKKPPLKKYNKGGDTAFMFFCSDWQLGKKDYGVDNTVKRYDIALQDAVERIKELRKTGVEIDEIYIVGMGDLTEGCDDSFYKSMPYNISLSLSEQYALARAMLMKTIDTFLPLSEKIILCGVPGNHGEMTRSGKGNVLSDRLDNSDTMHLKICKEIMDVNPDRYGHVEVNVSEDFHQVIDVKGISCGWTHGHMAGGSGGNPETKIENWWKGQMYGFLPMSDVNILVTAHYHHFRAKQQGDRTWFQCGSLDKSIDFTSQTGLWSHPAVLSFTVNAKGWDNLKIL